MNILSVIPNSTAKQYERVLRAYDMQIYDISGKAILILVPSAFVISNVPKKRDKLNCRTTLTCKPSYDVVQLLKFG